MILDRAHDIDAFRGAVRDWVRDVLASHPAHADVTTEAQFDDISRWWMRERAKVGLATPHWPQEFGGAGLSFHHQILIAEEFAKADAPSSDMFMVSLNHVPATLLAWGTEEQKRRYLPGVAEGVVWCQGFSEPNAGSDLASLRTSAVRDGDHYVVNGQKIWSSYSKYADYCILLTRTSNEGKKQEGITYFILDMKAPGVDVRPIKQMTGRTEFSEIFLTDVRIPVSDRIGEENLGWTVAQSTLAAERGVLAFEGLERHHYRLEAFIAGAPTRVDHWLGDAQLRRELVDLYADLQARRALIRSLLAEGERGHTGFSATPAMVKISATEWRRRMAQWLFRISAFETETVAGEVGEMFGNPMVALFEALGDSIAAGSNEVLRNVVAERALGLPR